MLLKLQRVAILISTCITAMARRRFETDPVRCLPLRAVSPLPGTGAIKDRRLERIINVPLDAMPRMEFRAAMENRILPAARADPDIVSSGGFDAHARDPLASLRFEEDILNGQPQLRILPTNLEGRPVSTRGGYDLKALGNSVQAHVRRDELTVCEVDSATGCRKPQTNFKRVTEVTG